MIWHPVNLGIWLLDFISWLVYASIVWRLTSGLADWQPAGRERDQLRSEAQMELAAVQGRWLLVLQFGSLLLYITGVSLFWPSYIPGAMCGMGVMQAMGPSGSQTLVLRLSAVAVLLVWRFIQRLEDKHREPLPVPMAARVLLLAGPLLVVQALTYAQALARIQPDQPVSCCAVLIESAALSAPAATISLSPGAWAVLDFAVTLAVAAWGAFHWRRPLGMPLPLMLVGLASAVLWGGVSLAALRYSVTPYLYEVLWHPCLWCLFLGEHHATGFVYFGLLGMGLIACARIGATAVVARRLPCLRHAGQAAVSRAGLQILAASLAFAAAAVAPAILWRLRTGGWLY